MNVISSHSMRIAKRTQKNQITLPASLVRKHGNAEYFAIDEEGGKIVMTPVRIQKDDAVHKKLEQLGICEQDVADAIEWARRS